MKQMKNLLLPTLLVMASLSIAVAFGGTKAPSLAPEARVFHPTPTIYNPEDFGAIAGDGIDDTAAIQAAASMGPWCIPGEFTTSAPITSQYSVIGLGASRSSLVCTDPDADILVITDGADHLRVADIRLKHEVEGQGDGLVLTRQNHNVIIEGVHAVNCRRGISLAALGYQQELRQVRADNCEVGIYARGLDVDGSSSGTTLMMTQPYAVNCPVGIDISFYTQVLLIQPTIDVKDRTEVGVLASAIGNLQIVNGHAEGSPTSPWPSKDGQFVRYIASSNMQNGVCELRGVDLSHADFSTVNWSLVRVVAQGYSPTIRVLGCTAAMNATFGPSNHLIDIKGDPASLVKIDLGANAMNGLTSIRDVQMLGTYVVGNTDTLRQ